MLFMFLVFLNWPVYMFFYASNESEVARTQDFFMKMSLGNIGAAELSCSAINWALDTNARFSCSSSFAELTELRYIGVTINDDTSCIKILDLQDPNDVPGLFDRDCFYGPKYSNNTIFKSGGLESFTKVYDELCLG